MGKGDSAGVKLEALPQLNLTVGGKGLKGLGGDIRRVWH